MADKIGLSLLNKEDLSAELEARFLVQGFLFHGSEESDGATASIGNRE